MNNPKVSYKGLLAKELMDRAKVVPTRNLAEVLEQATKDYVTKDSGERQDFTTGSRRDRREGKGRFDLIPPYPQQRLADLMERGAVKYGDRNWELGQPAMRYIDSALRHLNALLAGETPDEDHAVAVVFNMNGFMQVLRDVERQVLPDDLDDRPARMR